MGRNGPRPHDPVMTSLHIEHRINDSLDQWLETFNSFDEVRAQGGVTALQVRHAADDPQYLAVDLEFDTAANARSFLGFLETQIWPNSPHVDGTPTARLLESVGVGAYPASATAPR